MLNQPVKAHIVSCVWRDLDALNVVNITRAIAEIKNPSFSWGIGSGDALITRLRSEQATNFLFNPQLGDVLLFIDSDIYFEPDDAARMTLRCANGYYVIGGVYATRSNERPRPAVRFYDGTEVTFHRDAEPIEGVYASTGFLAIHRRVLEDMVEKLTRTDPQFRLCRTGTQSEMYPFFDCIVVDTGAGPEYLSEDWAFCYRAKQLGYKVWLDPSIRLGHMGFRTYWINDIDVDVLGTTYTSVTEGKIDKTDLLQDLSKYYETNISSLTEVIRNPSLDREMREEWEATNPKTPADVEAFYRNSQKYTLWRARRNLDPFYWERHRLALSCTGKVAVIGDPLGTFIHAYATMGRKAALIFQQSPARAFAEYRFKNANLDVPVFDTLADFAKSEMANAIGNVIISEHLEYMLPEELPDLVKLLSLVVGKNGNVLLVPAIGVGSDAIPRNPENVELFSGLMSSAGFEGDQSALRWVKVV